METNIQSNHVTSTVAATDELRKIASDIQEYLGKWAVRSRRVIEHASESMHAEGGFSLQRQKLEEQQYKWEVRRQREMDEIAEKAEELAAAWLKLESEQRQFLQMKESWQLRSNQPRSVETVQTASHTTSSERVTMNPPEIASEQHPLPETTSVRSPQYAPQTVPRFPVNHTSNPARVVGVGGRDAAIRQFEQLRREVAAKHGS